MITVPLICPGDLFCHKCEYGQTQNGKPGNSRMSCLATFHAQPLISGMDIPTPYACSQPHKRREPILNDPMGASWPKERVDQVITLRATPKIRPHLSLGIRWGHIKNPFRPIGKNKKRFFSLINGRSLI